MSGDSMTANHLEHKIATFPGSPEGVTAPAVKREAEEDWSREGAGAGAVGHVGHAGAAGEIQRVHQFRAVVDTFPPGGSTGIIARIIADKVSETLGATSH